MDIIWAKKIYTKQGFTKENILGGKKALDVGCGQRKLPGAIGMDIVRDSAADVIHDISVRPWPFADNSFDIILMHQVLEHLDDVLGALGEIHRVGKPMARVIIQVPHFRSVDAVADLTHRHFFSANSLDYVVKNSGLAKYKYTNFHFKKIGFWYGWPQPSGNPLRQWIKNFIHKHPDFYDQYLSLLLPVDCITWELEIIK